MMLPDPSGPAKKPNEQVTHQQTTNLSENNTSSGERRDAKSSRLSIFGLFFLVGVLGTGPLWVWLEDVSRRDQRQTELHLKRFVLHYHNFYDEHRRAPQNLEELESFHARFGSLSDPGDFFLAPELVRTNRFVILWNAVLRADGKENEEFVLGFDPEIEQRESLVMRAGGSVKRMTPEAFAKLPRIETKPRN